jgi:sugar/nucleoside kinase (ribokinase family)
MLDVYLYGMTVVSSIHRCARALPSGGGYAEIEESHLCPGGEAMNAALLLAGLGLSTALAGPHWGSSTRDLLERYARRYQIDVSGVTRDEAFEGLRDLVLVGGPERAVLGSFGRYFADPQRRWDEADARAIESARVAAIDPYFPGSSERAAEHARRAGTPYVTIDCPFDGALHASARATVVSREYRRQRYAGVPDDALFREYAARSGGVTVFTSGEQPILFGRAGAPCSVFTPFTVEVKSTLGAGDTFRAGVVFGVANGWDDAQCVRFAAGLAGLMCTRCPIADNIPTLSDVEAFLNSA